MKPIDLKPIERRMRRAYELSRLKNASFAVLPMLALACAAAAAGGQFSVALIGGFTLFCGGVFALWYGRDVARGVLPGALGGSIALLLALSANHLGHFCTGEQCLSWCVPACMAGGLTAGAIVSYVGVRARRGPGYWVSATGMTLLTGSLGCSCVGSAGVLALGIGFLVALSVSSATSWVRRLINPS